MFTSQRVEINVIAIVIPLMYDYGCFHGDMYNFPPGHGSQLGGGEELTFLSAKQVRKFVKDKAQVFVMLD